MRNAQPIPTLDVTRPALAPTIPPRIAEAQHKACEAVGPQTDPVVAGYGEDFPIDEPAAPEFVAGERVMINAKENRLHPKGWISAFIELNLGGFDVRRPTADELARFWPEDKA
jgi:hypothetical protein